MISPDPLPAFAPALAFTVTTVGRTFLAIVVDSQVADLPAGPVSPVWLTTIPPTTPPRAVASPRPIHQIHPGRRRRSAPSVVVRPPAAPATPAGAQLDGNTVANA